MDLNANVPVQVALVNIVAGLVLLGCGHRVGVPLVVVLGVGALIWLGFAAAYGVRSRGHRGDRGRQDRRANVLGVLGFLFPLAIAAAVAGWATSFDGVAFDTVAATFAGATLVLIPVAILASSMVDWFLILPFVYGCFAWAPIWEDDDALTPVRRRRYAKYWVVHRGLCEIAVFVSGAVLLAIVFVAVGNAVSSDKTLPVAIESLSIGVGLLAFLGPRIRGAVEYMLEQTAGLGEWSYGVDRWDRPFTGLVVDVSVGRGLQFCVPELAPREDGVVPREWRFVRLVESERAQAVDRVLRPDACDEAWRREAVLKRDEDGARPRPPAGPRPPEPAVSPAIPDA